MHELLNNSEYEPPELGRSFKESTPETAVANLARLQSPAWQGIADRDGLDDLPPAEMFDEDGLYIGTLDYAFDEAWFCD